MSKEIFQIAMCSDIHMYMVEALAADGRTVVSFHDVFGSGTLVVHDGFGSGKHRASVRPSLGLRVLLSKVGRRASR